MRRTYVRLLAAIAATLPVLARPADRGHAQEAPPDSQHLLGDLKSAQARLERTRYRRLPVSFGSGFHPCDERVGRYCYWHDRDDSWQPDQDHADLARERDALIRLLDSAAVLLPGDNWIAGQRVRYLVEAGQSLAAVAAAQSCGAEPWWCGALEGYARHSATDYQYAELAFGRSLDSMSHERRCEWQDISLLLPDGLRGDYSDLECGERDGLERRFWWLADPMYLVPGNERLTEHYRRLVLNEIMSQSATVRHSRWGNDNRELLIRYGYPIGWERERSTSLALASGDNVIGHHRDSGLHLIPTAEFMTDISSLGPGEWDLEPERPRSVYAPEYSTKMVWLEHDVVLFRRGGSAVVVASLGRPEGLPETDSIGDIAGDAIEAALALAPSELEEPVVRRRAGLGALSATVPLLPTLISVEALSRQDSLAARARYWLDIPARLDTGAGDFSISELLLLRPEEELPTDLETVIDRALPPGTVERGASLGLFWEMYGVGGSARQATIALTVEREGKGLFRRAGEWLGLVGQRRDRIEMRWDEMVGPADRVARAVQVHLTTEMGGEYMITIRVHLDAGTHASTSRRVVIR